MENTVNLSNSFSFSFVFVRFHFRADFGIKKINFRLARAGAGRLGSARLGPQPPGQLKFVFFPKESSEKRSENDPQHSENNPKQSENDPTRSENDPKTF